MSEAPTGPALTVVIPVRDMPEHLAACLSGLWPQLGEADRVIVVDDGSDVPVVVGESKASVLRLDPSRGPYAARNAAALTAQTDAVLFIDARSRPYPGLLDAHRTLLARPGIAMSCTNVEVVPGRTVAGRVAQAQNLFRLDAYVGRPGALDYFPTANLGVQRAAFAVVGGFPEMRSGSDARLCWNVQLAGFGALAVDRRTLMGWIPRDTVRGLLQQMYRYGLAAAELDTTHETVSTRARWSATARRLLRQCTTPSNAVFAAGAGAAYLAHAAGQFVGSRRQRHAAENVDRPTDPSESPGDSPSTPLDGLRRGA